jgi:hypothetical protein
MSQRFRTIRTKPTKPRYLSRREIPWWVQDLPDEILSASWGPRWERYLERHNLPRPTLLQVASERRRRRMAERVQQAA